MKRPLFVCLLLFIFGILGVSLADIFLILGIACIGLLLVRGTFDRKNDKFTNLVFCSFFIMGILAAKLNTLPESRLIEEIAQSNAEIILEGKVIDVGMTSTGRQKLDVNVNKLIQVNSGIKVNFKLRIILAEGQEVLAGSIIRVKGRLLPLESARNPGGYNEYYHLGARGHSATMYGQLLEATPQLNLRFFMYKLQSRIARVFDRVLPETEAAIAKSIIIGDKSGLGDDIKEIYRNAGIYHILAISGLHISIVCLFAQRLFSLVLDNEKSAAATLAFICIYCIFTGAGVSTVRAVIMADVLIGAKLLYRDSDLITSASFAAILLLLHEPLYIFDIGFQYSFSAVFGIGFLAEPVEQLLSFLPLAKFSENKLISNFKKSLSACIAVFLATAPVQIYHFNYIMPYSIIVNMIILPIFPVLVIFGFIMGVIGLFAMFPAYILSGAVYFMLKFYERICLVFEKLPFSKILIATPHYSICLLFGGMLMVIGLIASAGKFSPKFKRNSIFAMIACFSAVLAVYGFSPQTPTVTMLDVGQGDCTVIETGGDTFIIDGGGWAGRELGQNTGTSVIVPYLNRKGIKNIKGAFVSHLDFDHVFGIIELLYEKNVEKLYLPFNADKNDPFYIMLTEACEIGGTEIIFLSRGSVVEGDGIIFSNLGPAENGYYKDPNQASALLYADMGISLLFTGDIDEDIEMQLVKEYNNLAAHVLKLAHHGSKYSTSGAILDEVRPKIAIAGVGANNNYGHPSEKVKKELAMRGIPFYSTNTCGAIIIYENNGGIEVKTMLSPP